jgi:TRAP-type mannitol/chloroaromatic compound transport system substrate-binding protein
MDRRDFVSGAAAGAAGAALAGCGPSTEGGGEAANVQPQQNVRWNLASSFPQSLDTIFDAANILAERVKQLTGGRFQIQTYQAGELFPAFEVLSNVQAGAVEMGHSASYYFKGKDPALIFDCTVPFGLTARQYNAWVYDGGGMELLRELFAKFNVRNLPGGNTGIQMGGWFRNPIQGLEGLQGLRMRIPGFGGEVMSKLGVNVQNLSGGEIYPALERGAIDAVEWVGPYDDQKLGFQEIVKNYYYPGWWEPGPALTFYVNQSAWESLPQTYQHALEAAAAEANVRTLARYDARNPQALKELVDAGVKLRRFPDEIMRRAETATEDLLRSQSSGALYDKIYESYRDWRQTEQRWFATAEQAFANYAYQDVQLSNPG